MKRFDLAVVEGDGKPGSDLEHVVRIRVFEDGKKSRFDPVAGRRFRNRGCDHGGLEELG